MKLSRLPTYNKLIHSRNRYRQKKVYFTVKQQHGHNRNKQKKKANKNQDSERIYGGPTEFRKIPMPNIVNTKYSQ